MNIQVVENNILSCLRGYINQSERSALEFLEHIKDPIIKDKAFGIVSEYYLLEGNLRRADEYAKAITKGPVADLAFSLYVTKLFEVSEEPDLFMLYALLETWMQMGAVRDVVIDMFVLECKKQSLEMAALRAIFLYADTRKKEKALEVLFRDSLENNDAVTSIHALKALGRKPNKEEAELLMFTASRMANVDEYKIACELCSWPQPVGGDLYVLANSASGRFRFKDALSALRLMKDDDLRAEASRLAITAFIAVDYDKLDVMDDVLEIVLLLSSPEQKQAYDIIMEKLVKMGMSGMGSNLARVRGYELTDDEIEKFIEVNLVREKRYTESSVRLARKMHDAGRKALVGKKVLDWSLEYGSLDEAMVGAELMKVKLFDDHLLLIIKKNLYHKPTVVKALEMLERKLSPEEVASLFNRNTEGK